MVGGDITYKCLGNNVFEITITLYQDCLNGNPGSILADNPAQYAIFTGGSNPTFVRGGSSEYISKEIVDPNFSNSCINNPPNTCLQKEVFKFQETLAPSSTGYYIVYQRCCRNAAIQNLVNPGNIGVTYMAEIPPFTNGECPNNSAIFKSMPPQIICVNNPFSYDFSATDIDGDSITYELCNAYPGGSQTEPIPTGNTILPPPYAPVFYLPPYTYQTPVLGNPPLSIDLHTGILSGMPTVIGRFVVTVCAKEWRNGQLINTLSRDVQFVVTNCSKAVVADIPALADQPNVYAVQCKGYTVKFKNTSTGGFNYHWDFGVPGATSSDFEPTYTYPDTGVYVVKLVVNQGSTCPDSITRLVKIYPSFTAGYTWQGNLCPDVPIQFLDTSIATFPPVISWNWNFGDGSSSSLKDPVHTYPSPGGEKTVTLIAKTQLGCVDTASKIFPLSLFDVFAGNDTIIVKDTPFSLHGSGAQFFNWQPPDYLSNPNISNPVTSFPGVGLYTYVLNGSNDKGCMASDTINVRVVSEGTIFVPSAFSPNGDGLNDFLEVITVGYPIIKYFDVFNRYGQLVYNSDNSNKPKWDGKYHGKVLDNGVYFWVIKLLDLNGKEVIKKGDVTLLR